MKLFIMTDMEGVCGVINHDDWVAPQGAYYEQGKALLTKEVNAAVEGFFAAGATKIYVADGHGYGGIDQRLLDPRTYLIRGFPDPYPFMLDESFDAIAWVGQHPKAGTPKGHITHTGWFNVLDSTINNISVGEFGEMALCASFLSVPCILGTGDKAFCEEANALIANMETVTVKWGLKEGTGDECDTNAYQKRNLAAIHMHPKKARKKIKKGAKAALLRLKQNKDGFYAAALEPPFIRQVTMRGENGAPPVTKIARHESDLIKCMNTPLQNKEGS